MITGGGDLEGFGEKLDFFSLPGLMMDEEFKNLAPCDINKNLEEVKKERKDSLFCFFQQYQPEIFVIELYPFGRKAFRFELDPILTDIRNHRLPPCLVYCSLRDILVERNDQLKFEQRIITTLNTLFDGLLIHADENFTSLNETFSRTEDITVPKVYTGYVTPKPAKNSRITIRKNLQIPAKSHLIVASIGGGNVGEELLLSLTAALPYLQTDKYLLQIFTGPYASEDLFEKLKILEDKNLKVTRFSKNFPDWLAAADLSVSMAGYNTCMNILAAGVPALLYPFRYNQEQLMRVEKLTAHVPLSILSEKDLQPESLASLVKNQLHKKRYCSPVNLEGAANTVTHLERWLATMRK